MPSEKENDFGSTKENGTIYLKDIYNDLRINTYLYTNCFSFKIERKILSNNLMIGKGVAFEINNKIIMFRAAAFPAI